MKEEDKLIEFEKIITINDETFNVILDSTIRLFVFMKESNELNKMHTEFLQLRLKYSEKSSFAKDLVLKWAALPNEGKL